MGFASVLHLGPFSCPKARYRVFWRLCRLPSLAVALSLAFGLVCSAFQPLAAREITLHRIVATREPVDLAATPPELLPPGEVTWRNEAWRVAGATAFRIEAPEPEAAAALRLRPIPEEPGSLELRVLLFTRLGSLDYRYLEGSEHIEGGGRHRLRRFRVVDGIATELAGEPGRVTRIVVQDDHRAELRLRREGKTLVLRLVPPEHGGRPSGGARPWYAERPLTLIDYNLLAGGWADVSFLDVGLGYNALAELWLFDFLALKVNGFFSKSGEDSLTLTRLVARQQMVRGERAALWLEGGGAAWQRIRKGLASKNSPTATWTFGATAAYRAGPWGASAHVATVNGPLAMEIAGGWQAFRSVGLFLAWHGFAGDSAFAAGLGIDF